MISAADSVQPRAPRRRTLSDRCPGLLRPHQAEDGALVRLRLPGGQTMSTTLVEVGRIAAAYGAGSVQLTSRGNLQLRGLDTARLADLVEDVAAAGLLPSVSHERVRNIVASPLTGLVPGRADLRSMVTELDRALCASPQLAELPGRFLFALDDGHRDVTSLAFDLAYRAIDESRGLVLVGGTTLGMAVPSGDAVPRLIALAETFLRVRDTLADRPWHLHELADPQVLDPGLTDQGLADEGLTDQGLTDVPLPAETGPTPLGRLGDAASVGVPLSLLDQRQLDSIDTAAGGGPVVITPWRGVVIPGGAGHLPALQAAGLIVDESSVWSHLTACIGAPGCAKSAISTRAMATDLVSALDHVPALPVHLSGCNRRCGAPAGLHVDLVAPTALDRALDLIGQAR